MISFNSLATATEAIRKIFPEILPISRRADQGGLFLSFEGLSEAGFKVDEARFKIYLQGRSLQDDNFAIFGELDKLRGRIYEAAPILGDAFGGVEFEGFSDSLYVYVVNLNFKIYRLSDVDRQN